MPTLDYKPQGQVLKDFMKDDSFFRGIRGPVGSGKSVACCIEIMRRALMQKPNREGVRKSRWAVIRNTNPQLKTTTIKTWIDWIPETEWGYFYWSVPFTHRIQKKGIDIEVIFLALDRPEDVKKLLSLELTGVWINEAREIPKSIVDACTMRVGRFPSIRDGGPSWYGVICDTNAPEEDHWWAVMAGDVDIPDYIPQEEALMLQKPDDWAFYSQPPGMLECKNKQGQLLEYANNPKAENAQHLTPKYYSKIIKGKTKSWIDVYVLNKLGTIEEGKLVYPNYNDAVHKAKEPIPKSKDLEVFIGVDFGLTPAAIFGQRTARNRWFLIHELVCTDMGIKKFSELLKSEIATLFPQASQKITIIGDPAGDFRAQTDETTPFQIMRASGLQARPAPTNDVVTRTEAVNSVLNRMIDGKSGILIDPACKTLLRGFDGGYCYRRINVVGDKYDEKPDKNKYSHIHDALQYMFLGAGEGKSLLKQQKPMQNFVVKRNWDVFTRKPKEQNKDKWKLFRGG